MTETRPVDGIARLIDGFRISQAIHVAAVLGIADLLKDGQRASDDLAAATDTDPDGLYRLLRALASVGVFREGPDRKFGHTLLSECLRFDAEQSIAGWARLIGQEYFWGTWGHLMTGVKTGKNVFPQIHGTDVWTYRSTRPELNAQFNAAMTSRSRAAAPLIVNAYDFSGFSVIIDVGGNRGALLADILTANSGPRAINFDQPHVVSDNDLKEAGVAAERYELVSGSFFESLPGGGDAYILKSIIHDWADEESVAILRVCRKAMEPAAKLLIIDQVVPPPNEGPVTKFLDLNMLVLPGGRERTEDEFRALLEASGFRLSRVVPTAPDNVSIVEGVPV
jgi:hypothetical protein